MRRETYFFAETLDIRSGFSDNSSSALRERQNTSKNSHRITIHLNHSTSESKAQTRCVEKYEYCGCSVHSREEEREAINTLGVGGKELCALIERSISGVLANRQKISISYRKS